MGQWALLAAFVYAIYISISRTKADLVYRENTIESLRSAARLDPRNPAIQLALGVQLERGGEDPEAAYRTAAELSPMLAEPWLRLGLLAESRGDLPAAERYLLRAADAEHLLQPRAALMAFYSRTGNIGEFWRWARLAFERGYGDLSPLFDLCWRMAEEPSDVYTKAIPHTRPLLRSYIEYLLTTGRLDAVAAPAQDFLPIATSEDKDLLLTYCDRLLDRAPASALPVWNAACRRGLLPYEPLDPDRAPAVVNGAFRIEPLQRGYDWRVPKVAGVAASHLPGGGMEFSFDGKQPESTLLLSQPVVIPDKARRRVTVEYQTNDIKDPSGLWFGGDNAVALPAAPTVRAVSTDLTGDPSGIVNLRLRYQRPIGSVRTEGSLTIRSVRIEAIQ